MSSKFKISIQNPCTQDFGSMSPSQKGSYCLSCKKEVIDFSSMSEKEIISFFEIEKGKVCGRFHTEQLKEYSYTKAWQKSLPKPFFKMAMLSLLGLATATSTEAEPTVSSAEVVYGYNQNTNERKEEKDPVPRQKKTKFTYSIQGSVYAEKEALAGVNVLVKGTTLGTTTDREGNFTLSLQELPNKKPILIFSYIGYETLEKEIDFQNSSSRDIGTIELKPDVHMLLGEVAVVSPLHSLWWKVKSIFR